MQGLFKSRRAVRFFPKANSSGSGATVLSEPVFSSGQRYGRHSMPVVYLEAEFRGESWPHEREVHGARSLEGASPLFVASRRFMVSQR